MYNIFIHTKRELSALIAVAFALDLWDRKEGREKESERNVERKSLDEGQGVVLGKMC